MNVKAVAIAAAVAAIGAAVTFFVKKKNNAY